MMEKKLALLEQETVALVDPCGYNVTIRQQTGDDDDIISNVADNDGGVSLDKFLAAIIVEQDYFPELTRLTYKNIPDLKLCSKYFILLASRVFSLGNILKFQYNWPEHGEVDYVEDLDNYIWNYKEVSEFPHDAGSPLYFPFRIKPHPHGQSRDMEFSIANGKTFRFKFQDGHSEKYIMGLADDQITKNQELLSRNLEFKYEGKWFKVENFKQFTAREMQQIRNIINTNDPTIDLVTEIINPYKKSEKVLYPLVASPDFFYPREI